MDIELRHLRLICAIADAGSVTKAAGALGLAPPALTAQLQRVENSLGGRLFDRDHRGARPTALGDLVLARARLLLPAMRDLRDLANAGPAAGLRIGATNGPIIGGLVPRLTAAFPEAHVSTHTSWSAEELAAMVLAGRLDYAVIGVCGEASPPAEPGLVWRDIAVDAVCVLLAEHHPHATDDEVDLAVLAAEQWANAPGDGCFNDCFAAACAKAGFTPLRMYETDVGGCVDLLTAGTAIVLCQGTFRTLPGVAMLPIAGVPLRWRHVLGWHADRVPGEMVDAVVAHAAAAYTEVVNRNSRYAAWLTGHPGLGVCRDQTVSVHVSK